MPEPQEVAETIAEWLEEHAGAAIAFEKVEREDEQVLPEREQRELDGLPSRLAGNS